jgi:hypothetical protein
MSEKNESGSYSFSYSAGEREKVRKEIEGIYIQYLEGDGTTSKLEKLKALDRKAKLPALVISLVLGIGGTLVMGGGLSLFLALDHLLAGSILGIIGMGMIILAFPVHQVFLRKGKEKYSSEIIRLCNELLNT